MKCTRILLIIATMSGVRLLPNVVERRVGVNIQYCPGFF